MKNEPASPLRCGGSEPSLRGQDSFLRHGRSLTMKGHLRSVTRLWGLALLLVGAGLVIGGPGATAEAATLHVRNNGQDSGTCGAAASPCRSISQAIANAVAGDTLMVGPGRYGDLDGDGNFTSPGEEAAEDGSGCFCMIKVDKALTIGSRARAG